MDIPELVARLRRHDTIEGPDLAQLGAELGLHLDRFGWDAVGLRWDLLSLGRVVAHIDLEERHHQPFGIVHGGVWCAAVESAASIGAALYAGLDGQLVVGVSNTTDFLRPHRRGRVEVVAEVVHRGRTQQLWQVVLTRQEDGKPVARGQVRLHQLPAERFAATDPVPKEGDGA